jgi:hypothetical protein
MEFNDVRLQYEELASEIQSAITQLLSSGRYISGAGRPGVRSGFCPLLRGFARDRLWRPEPIALRSGLAALGVRPGDEVACSCRSVQRQRRWPLLPAARTAGVCGYPSGEIHDGSGERLRSRAGRERERWCRFIFTACRRI